MYIAIDLGGCQISAKGVEHLVKADWKHLRYLNLGNLLINAGKNQIGDEGC